MDIRVRRGETTKVGTAEADRFFVDQDSFELVESLDGGEGAGSTFGDQLILQAKSSQPNPVFDFTGKTIIGFETIIVQGVQTAVTLTFSATTPAAIVYLLNGGDDTVSLGDGSWTVVAGLGDDQVTGGAGNDLVFGGDGMDVIAGGGGNDDLVGDNSEGAVASEADSGDTILGGTGDDRIWGEQGDDSLEGGDGNDTIVGDLVLSDQSPGNDTLVGGAGVDSLFGRGGADVFRHNGTAGDGIDAIQDFSAAEGDRLDFATTGQLPASALTLNAAGTQLRDAATGASFGFDLAGGISGQALGAANSLFADGGAILTTATGSLAGTAFADLLVAFNAAGQTLSGGGGNDRIIDHGPGGNVLDGGSGDDTVLAGDGNDTIIAGQGEGNDAYDAGNGVDFVSYASTTQGVNVNLAAGTASGAEIGNDTLTSVELVEGGAGNDTIAGDGANNVLNGLGGADTAVFSGNASDYTVAGVPGAMTVTDNNPGDGDDGTDTLFGIELLQFADGTFEGDNAAPTDITLSNASVVENSAVGTVVGNLAAVDPDAGDVHGFAIVGGANATDFAIVGNQLRVAGPLDFEADPTREVLIRATDPFGNSFDELFTINVTNLFENEAPTAGADDWIVSVGTTAIWNKAVLLANDTDDDGDPFDLTAVGNAVNGVAAFADPTVQFTPTTVAPASFEYTVEDATGAGTGQVSVVVVSTGGGNDTVDVSGTETGGTFTFIDGKGGDDLIRGGAGTSQLFGGTGNDTVGGGAGDDTADGGGGTDVLDLSAASQSLSFTLVQSPSDTSVSLPGLGMETYRNMEGVAGSAFADVLVGSAAADRILGGNGNDSVTGGAGNDNLDGGGGTGDRAVYGGNVNDYAVAGGPGAMTVTDNNPGNGNEGTDALAGFELLQFADGLFEADNVAPTDITLSNATVAENSDIGTVVGNLAAVDPDVGDLLSFAIVGGANAADFTIEDDELRVAALIDFETDATREVLVRATDQFGNFFDELLTINVTDLLETPPVAADDNWIVSVGTTAIWNKAVLLANDTDFESEPFDVTAVGSAANGAAAFVDPDVQFTPTAVGGASFEYTIEDPTSFDIGLVSVGVVSTGGGDDTVEVSDAAGTFAFVDGKGGDDVIRGGAGVGQLFGGSGDDTVGGGAGDDTLDGGGDIDVLDLSGASQPLAFTVVQSSTDTTIVVPGLGSETYRNMEGVAGSAFDDTLQGSDSDDRILGGNGNDSVDGLAGQDTLTGGAGDDTLSGDGEETAPGAVNVFQEFTDATAPSAMAAAILAASSGIVIQPGSAAYAGARSAGSFIPNGVDFGSNGSAQVALGPGILLSSGDGTPETSNTVTDAGVQLGLGGDADLTNVLVQAGFGGSSVTNDAASLTFNFTVSNPAANAVSLDILFGSEEFPEFIDNFVDVAAVFVDGTNFALFNGDQGRPLSVLSDNVAAGSFITNGVTPAPDSGDQAFVMPIEYDGMSARLRITGSLDPQLAVHTIKIVIADTSDSSLDSGIFVANLRASTSGGGGISSGDEDSLAGGEGDDSLAGGAGNDTLDAGTGNDSLLGGSGDDQFVLSGGDALILDYQDGDRITILGTLPADPQDAILFTGEGNDLFIDVDADGDADLRLVVILAETEEPSTNFVVQVTGQPGSFDLVPGGGD